MQVEKKTYMKMYKENGIFSDTKIIEVSSREVNDLEIDSDVDIIKFFDRNEITIAGERFTGEIKNKSGRIIFGDKIHNLESVKKISHFDPTVLIRNMVSCKCELLAETRDGEVIILNRNDDLVINSKGKKIYPV